MQVDQMMNRKVSACHPQDSLNQAAKMMWDAPCGGIVVVDAQARPIGFLTDRDICMAAYTRGKLLTELTVEGAMAGRIVCCRPDDEITDAMNLMREKHVRRLPVVSREGTLIGLLSLDDLACEAGQALRGGVNFRLREQVADAFIAITRGHLTARSSSH
jgi:CBS domain-containing protein